MVFVYITFEKELFIVTKRLQHFPCEDYRVSIQYTNCRNKISNVHKCYICKENVKM